jgi:hypothetical protein
LGAGETRVRHSVLTGNPGFCLPNPGIPITPPAAADSANRATGAAD